ncbi:MBL fold metallo-hydrolase [candidate division WOR-3 bacterium]|nr:MBL fold metallo-hydrolase [candidate division WOR-3 bacterium]
MLIKRFVFGPVATNCYLVSCERTGQALVIDPDMRTERDLARLLNEIARLKVVLRYIVNTHHHSDHVSGNGMLKKATNAEILIHEHDGWVLPEPWQWWSKMVQADQRRPCPACGGASTYFDIQKDQGKAILGCRTCGFKFEIFASPPADRLLHHGDMVVVGQIEFVVIHTPGHSAGGICLYSSREGVLFSGDTLFKGTVGRTDMFDASTEEIVRSVRELAKLPEETLVYPGHGETTTIREEKINNPYLQN